MASGYTDSPHNFHELEPIVITSTDTAAAKIYASGHCFFYDTCSFRRHANLSETDARAILMYIKNQGGIIILTRCILMELASHSGYLNPEYLQYIRFIRSLDIDVLVIFEEDLFSVMEICFGTNMAINSYLVWPVRMMKGPVSTITDTLNKDPGLYDQLIKGRNLEAGGLYRRFFQAVRANKESGDNLGEELLAICLHILSHIPGEEDGKFCIITDDKGAGGKIDQLFRKTAVQHQGHKIIIFSTPKLVQFMFAEHFFTGQEQVRAILSSGTSGNLTILGTRSYDLRTNEISISCEELAKLIMTPNAIHITF